MHAHGGQKMQFPRSHARQLFRNSSINFSSLCVSEKLCMQFYVFRFLLAQKIKFSAERINSGGGSGCPNCLQLYFMTHTNSKHTHSIAKAINFGPNSCWTRAVQFTFVTNSIVVHFSTLSSHIQHSTM